MAAVAGILFTDLLGKPAWFEAGKEQVGIFTSGREWARAGQGGTQHHESPRAGRCDAGH